jgi:alanyl-tRNA synthetase
LVSGEVHGDNRHETFFEMMGNWSLGDYFKNEAITWSWEFLTAKEYLGIDPRKLAVTVFGGDPRVPELPKDDEAAQIWKSIGVPDHKITYLEGGVYESKHNWWGDFENIHSHCIDGNHSIGRIKRKDCVECNKKWGELELKEQESL